MSHDSINNLINIQNSIESKLKDNKLPRIIAVSKTFKLENILPLIEYGHIDFGENKVKEAIDKWTSIKTERPDLKLHLIGKLQTNKVKKALMIFDFIHSVDNEKLAEKIAKESEKLKQKIKIFIQINIGNESQKTGIKKEELKNFYTFCRDLNLDVQGLMCIPPLNDNSKSYFKNMFELNQSLGFKDLSMGMSSDYVDAAECGATFLRIGSKIFGNRN